MNILLLFWSLLSLAVARFMILKRMKDRNELNSNLGITQPTDITTESILIFLACFELIRLLIHYLS